MVGRNLIVKTLLASQLSYIAPVVDLPERVVKKLNTMFFKFIWNRVEAVKRNTIIADYERGGINIFQVEMFFNALKMSWIKKLNNSSSACWKNIPLYYVNKFGMGMNVFNCNCSFNQINTVCKNVIDTFPVFYNNMFKVWFNTKCTSNKADISDYFNQIIWNNDAVTANKKTLFYRDWIDAGFIFIKDLFADDGSIYSLEYFRHRIQRTGNILFKYFALCNALPSDWKNAPILDQIRTESIVFDAVPIEACSSKMFRHAMVNKTYVPPICMNYWCRRFPNYNFNWEKIWGSIPCCTSEARLISLNWKIIHNIYPTKVLLCKMGKEDTNLCNSCNAVDHPEHFFFHCTKTTPIWEFAKRVITQRLGKNFRLSVENVLFNYHNDITSARSKYINYVICVGKMCIGKFRYGGHPCLLFLFRQELRMRGLVCDDFS